MPRVAAQQVDSQLVDSPARRVAGLDGLRGLAALFVVLHHSYLMSYSGFPADHGPPWLSWLRYGHFAVVLFIALSGFSLAVAPVRNNWRLAGIGRFFRRRAWRILPPYWAALAFSLVIAWTIVPSPGDGEPTAKSVVVFGLLLQDVIGSPSPNGALWSIAVEAQLYLVFPVMLLLVRRAGRIAMLATVTALVVPIGLLADRVAVADKLMHLTPQFAVLFAAGAVAAGIVLAGPGRTPRTSPPPEEPRTSPTPVEPPASSAREGARRVPWAWLALSAMVPVVVLIAVRGAVWTVGHFFWVDLALAPAAVLLLVAVAQGTPRPFVRLLDSGPVRSLGSFSYSLYLIHAPIVVVIATKIVNPHVRAGLPAFLTTLALAVPVSLVAARLFAAVFELPFVRHRSWGALREALPRRRRSAAGEGAQPVQAAGDDAALAP